MLWECPGLRGNGRRELALSEGVHCGKTQGTVERHRYISIYIDRYLYR